MKLLPIAAFCLAATAGATMLSAPAQAQHLTATPVPSSSSTKASAKKAEPLTGFVGIKWGDSVEQAKKILTAKGATMTEASDYAINAKSLFIVNKLKVADYETENILLRFGSDGFYQANVEFYIPLSKDVPKIFNDLRLVISERFGDALPDQTGAGGLGGFGTANPNYLQWGFDRSEKASLKLLYTSSGKPGLEYRATDRAEREEARIRSEKAKSL